MKTSGTLSIVVGSLLLLAGVASAAAADYSLRRAPAAHVTELPFPRSWRAQSVWASDACWADCGSHCTWGIAACLEHDNQGHCLKLGNTCDRYCQRECRTYGRPLVPDLLDF